MKCSFKDCKGELEKRLVVHTIKHNGGIVVIENVPAEVCNVCGDTLFAPETVERIQAILKKSKKPKAQVPLFQYA